MVGAGRVLPGDTSQEVVAAPHVSYLNNKNRVPKEKLFSTEDHRKCVATKPTGIFFSFLFYSIEKASIYYSNEEFTMAGCGCQL
jgi:hypothetical protein